MYVALDGEAATRDAGDATRDTGDAIRDAGDATRDAGDAISDAGDAARVAGYATRYAGDAIRDARDAIGDATGDVTRDAVVATRNAQGMQPGMLYASFASKQGCAHLNKDLHNLSVGIPCASSVHVSFNMLGHSHFGLFCILLASSLHP